MTIAVIKTGSTYPALAARRGDFDDWMRSGMGLDMAWNSVAEEIAWVDAYHAKVRALLSPRLAGEDLAWLERETETL